MLALALWVAPGAGALAVALHLAVGHHHGDHRHADDHRASALELALAAVHGHRHDLEAAPDHEHPAPAAGVASVHAGAPTAVDLPPADCFRCIPGFAVESLSPGRRGPPTPLYDTHCSLLL